MNYVFKRHLRKISGEFRNLESLNCEKDRGPWGELLPVEEFGGTQERVFPK